jgi:ceramide glucosyltransferase
MRLLYIALSLLVLANAAYYLLVLVCTLRFARRREPPAAAHPPVTVLKAVKGLEPGSERALESFLTQDYPRYRVVFALTNEDDPALPLIRRLIGRHPERDARIVIARARLGPNKKMSNLAQAMSESEGDLIALADADVLVRPDWLRRLVAPFSDPEGDPQVGLVTCLYRAGTAPGLWSRLEGLTIASDLMPQVMVAESLEGISFGLGASICVRRAALEEIGGFAALADYLADDYLLGHRVQRAGWRLDLSPQVVDLLFGRQSARDYLSHQLRWARTYRACRPKGYAASAIGHGIVWGPLYLIASGFSGPGWAVLGVLAALRVAGFLAADRLVIRGGHTLSDLALLPLKDGLAAAIFAASFLGRTVRWRDKTFRLDREGRLTPP